MITYSNIVAILLASTAHASNCVDLLRVVTATDHCGQNKVFQATAMNCLQRFETAINASKLKLSKTLIDPTKKKSDLTLTNRQSKNYVSNSANTQMTESEFTALLAMGKVSRAEVVQYLENLKVAFTTQGAGDFDLTDPSTVAYLSQDPCYGEPRQGILQVIAKLDKMLGDLDRSRVAAKSLKEHSNVLASDHGIQSIKGADMLKRTPASVAPSAKGLDVNGSNISATTRRAPKAPATPTRK